MPLPGIIGAIGSAIGAIGGLIKKKAPQVVQTVVRAAPAVATIGAGTALGNVVTRAAGGGFGRRKRRRMKALSLNEMGTLMVLGQALGRRSPVVTLAAMKALGGRL